MYSSELWVWRSCVHSGFTRSLFEKKATFSVGHSFTVSNCFQCQLLLRVPRRPRPVRAGARAPHRVLGQVLRPREVRGDAAHAQVRPGAGQAAH